MSKNFPITAAEHIHHLEAGQNIRGDFGFSGGEQWVAEPLGIPVEATSYTLLAYIGEHRWCIIAAYAGDAE